MFGLGDAMYANGLVRALISEGREVTVATLERTRVIYEQTTGIKGLFVLENSDDVTACTSHDYDLVLDLSYVSVDRWPLRIAVMKRVNAWTVSTALDVEEANAVNAVIDYSAATHMAERMAIVFEELTGKRVPYGRIRPDFGNTIAPCRPAVYVNTVASSPERDLSDAQIRALVDWFNRKKRFTGLFYTGDRTPVVETDFVKNIRPGNFREALNAVAGAFAVVTPDTSIANAASAADVPVVVLYPSGVPEYYGRCLARETWSPLSRITVTLEPAEGEGHPNRKGITSVSAIAPARILYGLDILVGIADHEKLKTEVPNSAN